MNQSNDNPLLPDGIDPIYGRIVVANFNAWYNSFDDNEFVAIPFEPMVNVQDYQEQYYRIPQRLQKFFIAALTKMEHGITDEGRMYLRDRFDESFNNFKI